MTPRFYVTPSVTALDAMTAHRFEVDRCGRCEEVLSPDARLAALEASRAIRIHEFIMAADPSIQRRTPTLAAMARRTEREVRANG